MIRFAIANPLLVNLLLAVIALAGFFSWRAMPQEMFPLVELDKVRITTVFQGASPEEVERQITLPIEQEFDGMAEIDVLSSTSSEGLSSIIIDLKSGTDVDQFVRDADALLGRISDLPEEAERPALIRLETRFPVISMALYGDISRARLYEEAEAVQRRLMQLPGVASVGMAGNREWELWVEVEPGRLAALGVSLDEVQRALRGNLRDLPGGSIRAAEGDILLRGLGAAPTPEAVAGIVVRGNEHGGQLLLGELARIERRLEEPLTLGRFNGRPSVNLTVNKSVEASTIEVARMVREFAAELRAELPPTLEAGLFSDMSVYVKTRLETVKSSGLIGLLLVLISLYLFLNFRVALVTAMGIPVSFLVAIILINYFGYTINMVSLFAFLIALGMIVDDAIIVNENIYRHMEQGMGAREAAERGANEVFWPVIASTATTVAAFLPMYAIGGTMGAFIAVIPAVVSFALLGSLWEAFGVLPSHAAELLKHSPRRAGRVDWKGWLDRYASVLQWSLVNRYFVATATVLLLILTLTMAATRLPFQLFGHVSVGQFFVNVEAPKTYSLEESAALASRMEAAILDELDAERELGSLLTNVGVTFINFNRVVFGSNHIQLIIDLKKQAPQSFIERWVTPVVNLQFSRDGERERDAEVIINAVRERLQQLTGIERLSVLRPQGGPAGADIEVGVTGPDVRELRRLADEIAEHIRRLPGSYDVGHDMEVGKLEYRYSLNERGRQLGLTQSQLADAVRAGYQGLELVHVTYDEKRIPVRLIYPEAVRESAESLRRLPVVLSGGEVVYLGDVADIGVGRGLSSIARRDLDRLATVSAEVDATVSTPLAMTEHIREAFAELSERHPGYELIWLGEKKQASESMGDMLQAMVIALAIIFLILAALFKSLLDPLVVMFAIPFGLIGVIFGHLLFGHHVQFLSLIGFLALSGIVVNDSLILVDFAKRLRAEGSDRLAAMLEAGRVRARPILLTSVTTFLGVSPLIFFASGQTAFLTPMAVSLGFGLLFATALILVALPCFYLIADDLRGVARHRWRRTFGGM